MYAKFSKMKKNIYLCSAKISNKNNMRMNTVIIKALAIAARLLLGATFIFSGFVKAIDPWGSTYKFTDYLTAFDMTWMHSAAFMFALLQNAAELVIGVALVLGLRMKETAWGTAIFMVFFTILTFFIALTNPVTDCGCFGDALILTNWETFFKNILLMFPTALVFLYRKKYRPAYKPVVEWGWVAAITILSIGISINCYRHLPWIDFRPYHIGADIPNGMIVPEGMPTDEYNTTLLYEKDGVVKEFTLEDYPWDDTTWVWKDTKTVLVKEGFRPLVNDFSITTLNDWDITDEVLSYEGYTFLLVANQLNKSNKQALIQAAEIARHSDENGHRFYCLTASPTREIEQLKAELGLQYEFCTTTETTLKTIIRANPGLVLLQNGTVIGKWHYNDMPNVNELKPNLLSFAVKHQADLSKKRLNRGLFLAFVFFTFIFFHFRIEK